MRKQTFIQGTIILLGAGMLNRILGFVPRIALPRVISAEGVGLYQLGYPTLIVLLTLITGGIPLAVAKMVAAAESEGHASQVKDILRLALTVVIATAILITFPLVLSARWIANELLNDSRVYFTLLAMSPMLLIVGIAAVFRGYFQGRQNMMPTAVSQVVETIARIFAMLLLASIMLPYGVAYAAAGAMLGVTVGECFGLVVIWLQYNKTKPLPGTHPVLESHTENRNFIRMWRLFPKLTGIAVPVTGSRLVGSGSYFLESVLTVKALAIAGVASSAATTLYGTLQGMVIPVLLLPGVLTYALSVSLVPSLSEAAARNDTAMIHKRLHQSIKLAIVSGAPFAVFMYVLSEPICYYLYADAEVGTMLRLMAPVALFVYLQGPLQATLQALDRPGTALLNTFYGAALKLILIAFLASNPQYGIYGVLAAINVNIVLVTMLHWNSVTRFVKFHFSISVLLKTALAALTTGWIAHTLFVFDWHSSPLIRFIVALTVGFIVYLFAALSLGLITRDDLDRWPKLRKK
jgi:stage V sporulation protein B